MNRRARGRSVAERFPQARDVTDKNAFLDERFRPDLRKQLAFGHQMTGSTDERHQHAVHLRAAAAHTWPVTGDVQDVERKITEQVQLAAVMRIKSNLKSKASGRARPLEARSVGERGDDDVADSTRSSASGSSVRKSHVRREPRPSEATMGSRSIRLGIM